MKALDDRTIDEIRRRKANGETALQLAIEYNVHYRTIENYCKGIKSVRKKVPAHRYHILKRFIQVR